MRILKNKWFIRFARKENIEDMALCEAIGRAEKGLIDADLGGGLIKQRVSRRGEGRSGGYRSIIAFRTKRAAFFVFGFAKSDRENLSPSELSSYKSLARVILSLDDQKIEKLIDANELEEVNCHGQNLQE